MTNIKQIELTQTKFTFLMNSHHFSSRCWTCFKNNIHLTSFTLTLSLETHSHRSEKNHSHVMDKLN